MLWLKGNGPANRDMDNVSNGPTLTIDRGVDLRVGSIIVAVASL
jgi:hypothetical protein